jgi:hypothetical protein
MKFTQITLLNAALLSNVITLHMAQPYALALEKREGSSLSILDTKVGSSTINNSS